MAVDADPAAGVAAERVVLFARVAVEIEISEAATGTPERRADARRARHVGEGAVSRVAVQRVGAQARDVQVDPAVPIVVGRTRAHAIPAVTDPGGRGHVLEAAV